MDAIVTGGAGFIGSHLCERLATEGIDVTIIDNLFRGKLDNISRLLNEERNSFYNLDLASSSNCFKISDIILNKKPSFIFHYAAINGTQYFYDAPSMVLETNIAATYNLMKSIRHANSIDKNIKPIIIYASSSEVYGEPLHVPTSETDITYVNIDHIRDSYAASKLIGEFYVKLFSDELKLNWYILRLFNVYGPRMVGTKYGQVIPEFINRLKLGEYPLKIYGDGLHTRSFCYVDDNIELTYKLINTNISNEVYNIGNDEEISILELAKLIMDKMNMEPKFDFLDERVGDHKKRRPDICKLTRAIGNHRFVDLETGIDYLCSN